MLRWGVIFSVMGILGERKEKSGKIAGYYEVMDVTPGPYNKFPYAFIMAR